MSYMQQVESITTHKQQDYFINTKQLVDNFAFYEQKVKCMAVFHSYYMVQLSTNINPELNDIMSFFKTHLAEYGHFQGSWSVPRRSGSHVGKLWLMVVSFKLGLLLVSGNLGLLVESEKLNKAVQKDEMEESS